jgi:hypothetical protein
MTGETDSVNARILELIEEARRLAYAQGYRDAVQNILTAASAVDSAPSPEAENRQHHLRIARRRPIKRAPWGIVPKAIDQSLNDARDVPVRRGPRWSGIRRRQLGW